MATESDKTNIAVISTVVAVGAFAMISVSAAVTALTRAEVKKVAEERGSNADLNTVQGLKDSQRDALNAAPHWADKAKGLVAIPIDRAMSLLSQDLRRNPRLATPYPPGKKDEADAGVGDLDGGAAAPHAKSKKSKKGAKKGNPAGEGSAPTQPKEAPSAPQTVPPTLAPQAPSPAPQPAPVPSPP